MPEAVWATMPLEALMQLVQNEAGKLATALESATADEAAYQRQFWAHWRQIPVEWGVTHAQRDCELACQELGEIRRISAGYAEQQRAHFDALVAVLRARSA